MSRRIDNTRETDTGVNLTVGGAGVVLGDGERQHKVKIFHTKWPRPSSSAINVWYCLRGTIVSAVNFPSTVTVVACIQNIITK